jgi:hypothetical protein
MTVQLVPKFVSPTYTDSIVNLYGHRLLKVDSRPGFYEDIGRSAGISPIPISSKELNEYDGTETEEEKLGVAMISNVVYLAKQELENHYGCGELSSFEGGMVMLTDGAVNGLHSDMYNLDGSKWEDGSGREDELEYSALLYMSDYGKDFVGGSVSFPKQELTVEPAKGLLVYFRGDLEHIHEVGEITSGKRYAIVMFFGK